MWLSFLACSLLSSDHSEIILSPAPSTCRLSKLILGLKETFVGAPKECTWKVLNDSLSSLISEWGPGRVVLLALLEEPPVLSAGVTF